MTNRAALTLVELLVTITIMAIVVAVSIPAVKPMLASNKVKNGAETVSTYLTQARARAMEEGRAVGVRFERYTGIEESGNYPYNGAALVMRQVAEPKPYSGSVKDVYAIIDSSGGRINFCTWNSETSTWVNNSTESTYWSKLVSDGDLIQCAFKGPKYTITKDKDGSTFSIDMGRNSNDGLPEPNFSDPLTPNDKPVRFRVYRQPQPDKIAPTMAPPVALPQGVVVDLDCSGMEKCFYNETTIPIRRNEYPTIIRDDFAALDSRDKTTVTIMFSPTGEVDRVYANKKDGLTDDETTIVSGKIDRTGGIIPSGLIFLNIGTWERAGSWINNKMENTYLPDDGLRNYMDMNNYWVTIFPRNGLVRINRVAKSVGNRGSKISSSREFAQSLLDGEVK
jgi:type II secretory pathway pseudopilin PulG